MQSFACIKGLHQAILICNGTRSSGIKKISCQGFKPSEITRLILCVYFPEIFKIAKETCQGFVSVNGISCIWV